MLKKRRVFCQLWAQLRKIFHCGKQYGVFGGLMPWARLLKNLNYRISSFSYRGNYSFFNLEIQRSQYIKVRKLFKGGNYMRKYGNLSHLYFLFHNMIVHNKYPRIHEFSIILNIFICRTMPVRQQLKKTDLIPETT